MLFLTTVCKLEEKVWFKEIIYEAILFEEIIFEIIFFKYKAVGSVK